MKDIDGHQSVLVTRMEPRTPTDLDHAEMQKGPEGPLASRLCGTLKLERAKGFEPSTLTLARLCSTPELHPHSSPAAAITWHRRNGRLYAQSKDRLQPKTPLVASSPPIPLSAGFARGRHSGTIGESVIRQRAKLMNVNVTGTPAAQADQRTDIPVVERR